MCWFVFGVAYSNSVPNFSKVRHYYNIASIIAGTSSLRTSCDAFL